LSFLYMILTSRGPTFSPDVSFARVAFTPTQIFINFEHALLHESRCPCPCRIYFSLCVVCPSFSVWVLVGLKHRAYLITGISLGFLGRIPIPLSMFFVVPNSLLPAVPILSALAILPLAMSALRLLSTQALPAFTDPTPLP
jgi:hypothetical protein